MIVEEYAASKGRFPPIRRPRANSIYVCTIEKSNGLVNSLIETGKVDELGMVIVDEVIMGEGGDYGLDNLWSCRFTCWANWVEGAPSWSSACAR